MALPLLLAKELRKRGHMAEVWYLYTFQPAYESEPGVRVLFDRRISGLVGYLRVFCRLLSIMRRFRPDAVLGVLPLGNVFGLTAAMMVGCPSRVASQHNPAKSHSALMQLLDKLLGTAGIYTANIAVSYAVRRSYETYPRAYVRRLVVIQNAVPARPPAHAKAEARINLGLPQDAWIVGNVGRLSYQKNQEFIFDAMTQIPSAHLAIAGDGELRNEYMKIIQKKKIADRVHLLGSVPDAQMPDYYEAIDVFVLPSRFEGLPISLIEAMNAGLPIIASDIPPMLEVLRADDGRQAGLILGVDSISPWVDAIHSLINDQDILSAWSKASRERAKDFSPDYMVDQYEACLFEGQVRPYGDSRHQFSA